jgi:hypothetical protein
MSWTAIQVSRLALILTLGALALCRGAVAADATHGIFGIQVENDLFGGNSDRLTTAFPTSAIVCRRLSKALP